VARYLVVVSMALNDVLASTKRLIEGLEADAAPHENVHAMRLAGAHIWEMLKFLDQSARDWKEIAEFVSGLPDATQEQYEAALARSEEEGSGSFRGALARLRDHFSHYSVLDRAQHHKGREELTRALEAVADHEGVLHVGNEIGDFRALYADEVAGQLMFRSPGEDLDPFREFITEIRDARGELLLFGQLALREYLAPMVAAGTLEAHHG
jgi:hypothetical protein